MLNIRDPRLMLRASLTTSLTTTDYPTLDTTAPITTVLPMPVSTEGCEERTGQVSSLDNAYSARQHDSHPIGAFTNALS